MADYPSITCPRCGRTSYNRHDIEERYCGACRLFHDDMAPQTGRLIGLQPGDPVRVECLGVMIDATIAMASESGRELIVRVRGSGDLPLMWDDALGGYREAVGSSVIHVTPRL